MVKNFALPNFTTTLLGTLGRVLDNDNITKEKSYLNGLGMTRGKYGGVFMMPKTVMEVNQDYTVFN